jgi:hypothetical protein
MRKNSFLFIIAENKMKKKILIIINLELILYLYIIGYINSADSNTETTPSSICVTGTPAVNETQCNLLTTLSEYCCYLSPIDQIGDGFCLKMDKSIFKGSNTINYNQTSYSIYCGYGSINAAFNQPSETDKYCFKINPQTYQECYLNSTAINSCCYYKYKGMSGCYWLGTDYIGSTVNDDITLICSGSRIINKHYSYFFIFVLICIFLF